MKRELFAGIALSTVLVLGLSAPAMADSTATPPAAAAPCHEPYSTNTPVGVLLDDPKAKEVLVKLIPDLVNSPQLSQGLQMSMREMQPYAPDTMTDELLAKVDTELAKLNCKP